MLIETLGPNSAEYPGSLLWIHGRRLMVRTTARLRPGLALKTEFEGRFLLGEVMACFEDAACFHVVLEVRHSLPIHAKGEFWLDRNTEALELGAVIYGNEYPTFVEY